MNQTPYLEFPEKQKCRFVLSKLLNLLGKASLFLPHGGSDWPAGALTYLPGTGKYGFLGSMADAGTVSVGVKVGRLWFKYRSHSPIPLFLLLILLPADFDPSRAFLVGVIGLILFAEVTRIWAVGYAGSATRTRGDQVNDFVHTGPWRFVRNPLYLANIIMYVCCGVLFGSFYLSVVFFFYFVLQYSFIVSFEEELLERTFGEKYQDYKRRVPRWLFSLVPLIPKSPHPFHLVPALRSERATLIAIVAMAIILLIKRIYF